MSIHCQSCGAPLGAAGIEGCCPACLAAMALRDGDAGMAAGAAGLGGYQIIEELGRGGMGVVYRARQTALQREVALKVLLDGPFADAAARARFRREAESAASLRHANIVTVHEVGETDGHPYFSMELVEGETLAGLTRDGPLEPRRAAGYLLLVARAISAAHSCGVLHRDLKPGNIIVDRDDQPRITDFGLAIRLDADPAPTRHLAGSPGYQPPEQADPARGPAGVTTDVYALGATLYHLLTGRPPFAAATVTATLQQVLEDEPAPLRRLNSQVPRDLETICLKCLRKDPGQRYPGTDALADDLQAFLDQRPIQARPVASFERALLWGRRRPAIAALSAALLLALIAGVIATVWQWRHNQRQLYAADLRVASEALAQGDLGLARELLELHRPASGRGDFAWRLLRTLSAGDTRTVLGEHPWIVGAIAWSADGRRLASASVPSGTVAGDLRLWMPARPADPAVVLTTNTARQLRWFPDHRRLLAVHFDGFTRVWDADSHGVEQEFPGRSAGLSDDGRWLVTCEGDPFVWHDHGPAGTVTLFDLAEGTHTVLDPARLATISPGGRWLATSRFDGWVWLRDRMTGIEQALACDLNLWALEFSGDDSRLVATGFGADPTLWQLDRPEAEPVRLRGHTLHTWRAAFAPDGRQVLTTSSDQTLRLWDADSGRETRVFRGHAGEVWDARFSPDGTQIASGSKDRTVVLWPVQSVRETLTVPARPYAGAQFVNGGTALVTRSLTNGSILKLFNVADGQWRATFAATGSVVGWLAAQNRLLLATGGFQLEALPPDGKSASVTLPLEPGPPHTLPRRWTTTADGSAVAGWTDSGQAWLWETASGRLRATLSLPTVNADTLQLSPDSHWLAITAGEEGFLLGHWNRRSVVALRSHRDQGKAAAFSPDNRLLATASVDGTIKLWAVRSGRELATLRGHRTSVGGVAFAPDGVVLVSCEPGAGLRLWHLPTRRELAVISLSQAGEWLSFSPDGRTLAVELSGGGIQLLPAP